MRSLGPPGMLREEAQGPVDDGLLDSPVRAPGAGITQKCGPAGSNPGLLAESALSLALILRKRRGRGCGGVQMVCTASSC